MEIFFVYFIAVRISSCYIMHQFMVYQRGCRLADLDISKQQFNKVEKKSKVLTKALVLLYGVILIVIELLGSVVFTHSVS